ncbi:twin arginine translocase protein A [Phycisphaerae bacterium RAS1]|nr:twin arginine translocase protein A [Phycisphaerae bacterium RAS1]
MGWFSPMHWLVIGIVALLLFGNRLPDVARSLGRAFNEFKKGLKDVGDDLKDTTSGDDPPKPKLRAPANEPAPRTAAPAEKAPVASDAGEQH